MHRVVCAVNDSLYYQMLCKGLLKSLLKYHSKSCRLTVLLDGKHNHPLEDLHHRVEIKRIDPLNILCGSVRSRTTFARLEIPELFPDEKRVLYLDVDTFLMTSIDELFTRPFETVAAVVPGNTLMIRDFLRREFKTDLEGLKYRLDGREYWCGINDHKYFNAGVMLMHPLKWRELRIKEHVQAIAQTHLSKMYTSDEMALNLIFRGSFTQLDGCYNAFNFTRKVLHDPPRIWHFNTTKPIFDIPLSAFQHWLSLFDKDDQQRLKMMERLRVKRGKSALLSMTSESYHHL